MRYVTQQPCLVCDRQLADARQTRVASHVPKQSQKQDIAMAIELPRALGEQSCPELHGGAPGSGAPRGNKNALKHGRYTREAIEARRQLQGLLRQSRKLVQEIE